MDIEAISNLIGTLGFPIALVILFLVIFYKCIDKVYDLVLRGKDEAITRENKLREEAAIREEKLMEYMRNQTATLQSIAVTMESSNEINRELNETNKSLACKIDDISEKLVNIDAKVDALTKGK